MKRLEFKNKLRLFIAIFVILFSFEGRAQVVMPDQVKPGDTWGLIDVNNLYGGFMQVSDYATLLTLDVQFIKKGMVVIVYDYDGNEFNGIDTRSFMFVPAAGTWNYTSPFDIPAAQQNDVINPLDWVEVSIRPVAGVNRIDTVSVKALIFDGDTILGFSTDPAFANASDTLFPSQKAVALYVDSLLNDLRAYGVFDTILVDTAYINSVAINYFTLNGRTVNGISNDSLLSGADSLKLITEYSVQTRIDSVLEFVQAQFSSLSQNLIEDTQDGESMVKVTDGDSVIVRIANDTAIVIDPNRNVTFTNATLIINGDSVKGVADKGESFATAADSTKVLTSLSTVDSMIYEGGNNINFAFGQKQITRAGWSGVTGSSVNADNLEDFLKKIFFPVTSPMVEFFKVGAQALNTRYSYQVENATTKLLTSNVGTELVTYASWKVTPNYTLNYQVLNRSVRATDSSDDTPIDSIAWYLNGVRKNVAVVGNLNQTLTNSFTLNTADLLTNPTTNVNNNLVIRVYDAYPNLTELNFVIRTSQALQSTIDFCHFYDLGSGNPFNGATLPPGTEGLGTLASPYLIERDGNPIDVQIRTQMDAVDETVTDIDYTTTGFVDPGVQSVTINGTDQVHNLNVSIAHANLTPLRVGAQVRGNVYNAFSTPVVNSNYIQLADRGYVGYLNNAQRLDITNQGAVITAFSNANNLMNYQFKTAGGVTLKNETGSIGYLCFAMPVSKETVGKTYKIQTFDLGIWSDVITGQAQYNVTTNGATESYYIVYINDGSANTNNGGTVQARIIEN